MISCDKRNCVCWLCFKICVHFSPDFEVEFLECLFFRGGTKLIFIGSAHAAEFSSRVCAAPVMPWVTAVKA
jgi:hypothetical protein